MIVEVPNYIVSTLSFIGFILLMIPFPWHWKSVCSRSLSGACLLVNLEMTASNRGTCLYIVWAALGCLNQFINSVVWDKNVINRAPVWCDISTRIAIGISIAIPAASLCIMRHLYQIMCLRSINLSKKRRTIVIDVAIGLGLPLLGIIFYYFVEGHRFNILEDIGCYPAIYGTPLAFVLVLCWPLVIGVVCGVYGCLIIHACTKRYTGIRASVVSLPHSFRHYYRLCALSFIASLCTIAASAYVIAVDVQGGLYPWKGWADDHYAFSAVRQVPAVEWMNEPGAVPIQASRFFLIACSLVFFSFFGLTEEVRELYRNAYVALVTKSRKVTARIREACSRRKRLLGFDTSSPCQERDNPTLPISIQPKLAFRHDLMASFSPNFSLSNVAFGASDFRVITLADKQESDSSIEFSSEIGTLPHTPSSDQSVPNTPMPPARPEPAYVDVRGSRGLDGLPSDNIV
ncbi:hypothetical protein PILCRDRAFT_198438 [Piloderma croceum F 1598]|uniref:Uncharacterized protein n=1 Tax=Piloderma croceum (strain F 1598) TaxID=765440 RepID=A0A0C3CJD7_PILCF|nr:hypothetical protein PILCRDRAFT_198438 [Piloderma croceum F 1598]